MSTKAFSCVCVFQCVLVVAGVTEGLAAVRVAQHHAHTVYMAVYSEAARTTVLHHCEGMEGWVFLSQDVLGEVLRKTDGQGEVSAS